MIKTTFPQTQQVDSLQTKLAMHSRALDCWLCVQVASEGKMCIMAVDVRRALAVAMPNALKVYLAPGAGLAQAVRAGLPPGTKEPQVQQAIQTATAEADKAKVSSSLHANTLLKQHPMCFTA